MIGFNSTFDGSTNAKNLVCSMDEQAKFGVCFLRQWVSKELNVQFNGDKGLNIRRLEWAILEPAIATIASHIANFAVTRQGFGMEQGLKRLETDFRNSFDALGGFSVRLSNKDTRLEPTKAYSEHGAYHASLTVSESDWHQCLACWKPKADKSKDVLDITSKLEPMALDPSPTIGDLIAQDEIDKGKEMARAMNAQSNLGEPDRKPLVPLEYVEREAQRLLDDRAVYSANREVRHLRKLLRIQANLIKKGLERENRELKRELASFKATM